MSIEYSPYSFLLKSQINGKLSFESEPQKIFNRAIINDSIFDFYPYMEVNVNDNFGKISDLFVSLEGVPFESKLGFKDEGADSFLQSKWVCLDNQSLDQIKTDHVGGNAILSFRHQYYQYDSIQTKAWNDSPLNITKEILSKEFKSSSKSIITEIKEKDYYYRVNSTIESFLTEVLAPMSYSSKYEFSPFVTFVNAAGEFYFCALDELMQKAPLISTKKYTLDISQENMTSPYTIMNPRVYNVGMTVNKENYNKKLFKLKRNGTYDFELDKVENHLLKGQGSFLVRKDVLSNIGKSTYYKYEDFGVYDEKKDQAFYKAWRNQQFIDTILPLRMEFEIRFNPRAITGHKIPIEFGSAIIEKNNKSPEYSGDWLILESKHLYSTEGIPTTQLLVGKSRVLVHSENPFKKDYIS